VDVAIDDGEPRVLLRPPLGNDAGHDAVSSVSLG
jgi:hypothetical protein